MSYLIPYAIVAFIYMVVAASFWLTKKSQTTSTIAIAVGLILHGWLLYRDIFAAGEFNFSLHYAVSAIFWLTVLIYWLASLKHQLQSLQAFILPPAAALVLLAAMNTQSYHLPSEDVSSFLFISHVAIAMFAYGLFTFAALHALLMTIATRSLHNKSTLIKLPDIPPLMVMERLLFKVILLGFTLLTFALISGMLFSEEIFGQPLQFTHKVLFSIASWLIYAWLLFGRYAYGWRGKKAIFWTLAGFILLLLAYVGSRFVSQFILS